MEDDDTLLEEDITENLKLEKIHSIERIEKEKDSKDKKIMVKC